VQKEASISQVIYQVFQSGNLVNQELSLRNDLGDEYLQELETSLRKEGYEIHVREPFRLVYGRGPEEYHITLKPVVTVSIDLMDNVVVRTFPDAIL